jgi:3-methyladenine DNA glycosylase/8-oxoguanine DNA glycosylase
MPVASCGSGRRAPTFTTPTPCWPGSSTTGRTSIPGRGWPSCRRWIYTAPCCSRSSASSCPSRHPARILVRIQALFGGHLPSPAELLAEDPGKLREAGLSWRKISTLRDLAGRLEDGRLNPDVLSSLPDNELMAQLTAIPGIGPWTVQGALIIALQREDVVLPGDLALRKAVQLAYQLDHVPSQQEVLAIAEKWRPYRSLATSYLFSAAFEPAGTPPIAPSET